jgi:hypothetical protein
MRLESLKIRVSAVRLTRTFGARPTGAFGVVVRFANRSAPGDQSSEAPFAASFPERPRTLRRPLTAPACIPDAWIEFWMIIGRESGSYLIVDDRAMLAASNQQM